MSRSHLVVNPKKITFLLVCLFLHNFLISHEPGLIIFRSLSVIDSLNKQPLWLEKFLPQSIKIQTITDRKYRLSNEELVNKVIFLPSLLHHCKRPSLNSNCIVCVQSVFEASQIPEKWVEQLNREFDFVTVPSKFCEELYFSCGVKIPIFVAAQGCFLEDWLDRKFDSNRKNPFVYIASGSLHQTRKNHDMLILAFIELFGDREDVILKIQVRESIREKAKYLIKKYNLSKRKNIQFHYGDLEEKEYLDFFLSGNCLVNISAGEGYSIPPREALAIGMPAIVTNNSAQKEICQTGFVRSVECTEIIPALFPWAGGYIGHQWNPTLSTVKEALLDVYENYDHYLELSKQAKPWIVEQTGPFLVPKWTTLLHPKEIRLGDTNEIIGDCLITNSKDLYLKYSNILNGNENRNVQ